MLQVPKPLSRLIKQIVDPAKLLAGVVPLDAVGIVGCAPTPLSAELHLLAVLQTQCTGTHFVDLLGAASASSVLHLAPGHSGALSSGACSTGQLGLAVSHFVSSRGNRDKPVDEYNRGGEACLVTAARTPSLGQMAN